MRSGGAGRSAQWAGRVSVAAILARADAFRHALEAPYSGPRLVPREPEYTPAEVRQLEIAVAFYELGGGSHFERLTNALWLYLRRVNQRNTAYRSSPHGAQVCRERDARQYERLRALHVDTGTCKYCGKPFPIDGFRAKYGKMNACSRGCQKRSTTKRYTINGRTLSVQEWAKEAGVPHNRVYYRLKRGMSIDAALAKEKLSRR